MSAGIEELLSNLSIATSKATKGTGLVYDDRMTDHRCLYWPEHLEKPERYLYSLERCKTYNLIKECSKIAPRFAEEDEILLLHDKTYFEVVKKTKHESNLIKLEELASRYDSVYFHPKTFENALLSAGCALELLSSVVEGKTRNGMAIIRPPGHHAMERDACGYCYFNNVALVAKQAILKYDMKRILIVDWDVHHGQATQQMFYDDPRVLYFSIHRFEHGLYWPNLAESNVDHIGKGAGRGFNINVPLNRTQLGNSEYFAIFHNLLLPVAYEFDPELILISAGYDAAIGCPEGEMEVTPMAYPHFLNLISGLAGGKVCVFLEGGYCLPSLAEGVALTLRGLLGKPCPKIQPTDIIDESVIETILNVITTLRPFWKCLQLQDAYTANAGKNRHIMNLRFLGTCAKPPYDTRDCCPIQEQKVCIAFECMLEKLIGETDLFVPQHSTCFVTDEKMKLHVNTRDKSHPETPERLVRIHKKFREEKLLDKCLILYSRKATKEELLLVHTAEYVETLEASETMTNKELNKLQKTYDSIFLCPESFTASKLAVGCLLQVIDSMLNRESSNGFALIRPPGHHAEISGAAGFCLFNSVAIAAKYALTKYHLQKILILDWDIHHGNGIQHIFYGSNKVLYISFHRYEHASFFPCSNDASHEASGEGQGLGFNVNIPWNGLPKDGDYLAAFFYIVLPICYEFCPDLVLVSSGFDAVQYDPLGESHLTPACFGHMTKLLSGLANGKIILALEGGYNLSTMPEAAAQCMKVLLNQSCDPLPSEMFPSSSAIITIQNVVEVHQKYWKCLQFNREVPIVEDQHKSDPSRGNPATVDSSKLTSPVTIPTDDPVLHLFPPAEASGISDDIWSETMFCVTPLEDCPHLELLQSLPAEGLDIGASCQICGDAKENWVCLHCYQVFCGRFVNEHMLEHGKVMQHCLTLSYSDLSVWCYGCDSYVHNDVLMPMKEHVHQLKFGVGIIGMNTNT